MKLQCRSSGANLAGSPQRRTFAKGPNPSIRSFGSSHEGSSVQLLRYDSTVAIRRVVPITSHKRWSSRIAQVARSNAPARICSPVLVSSDAHHAVLHPLGARSGNALAGAPHGLRIDRAMTLRMLTLLRPCFCTRSSLLLLQARSLFSRRFRQDGLLALLVSARSRSSARARNRRQRSLGVAIGLGKSSGDEAALPCAIYRDKARRARRTLPTAPRATASGTIRRLAHYGDHRPLPPERQAPHGAEAPEHRGGCLDTARNGDLNGDGLAAAASVLLCRPLQAGGHAV